MTDLFKILENLAACARREESPTVDVSSRVVLRLRSKAPTPDWPMVLFASSAAVAAVVVLSISLPLIEMLTDPLSAFFLTAANALP
jgi:hypothetical protein